MVIEGNFIGTDASGILPLGNAASGVKVSGAGVTVGPANVIGGNGTYGVYVDSSGSKTVIRGNWIGAYATYVAILCNRFSGVRLYDARDCIVEGTNAADRKCISGNGHHGLALEESNCMGNIIAGNYIGVA